MGTLEQWGVTLMVGDEMPELFEWVRSLEPTESMTEDLADWHLIVFGAEQADRAAQILGVPEDEAPAGMIRTGSPDPEVQAMFQTDVDTLMAAWAELQTDDGLGEAHEIVAAHRELMGEI